MATILGALLLILTPGGHGSLRANGWVYAESGTTKGGSAAVFFPSGVKGFKVRVWEDGSFRVKRGGRVLLSGCIDGKGCSR